jgi:ubiquinone/menaquinone biosynthesis C-methylase UbiE
MKREVTTRIRYVLDELVPPVIRDSRWFMWPFFVLAYGTFSVRDFMNFKSRAYSMTEEEYRNFYSKLGNSVSRRRETDLNEASIRFIVDRLPSDPAKMALLDVGAGNGYLLARLAQARAWQRIAGVDVVAGKDAAGRFEFHAGILPSLPFADKEFDVVTCTHVIEHLLDVEASVKELLRVTKQRLFVVLPRQRYFYYTLDEHLNFYPEIDPLLRLFRPYPVTCTTQDGDWAIAVDVAGLVD